MKNLKKVLAMVLAFACTFTMFAGAKVFEDVPAGSDYSEAITMLSDLGIIQGKDDGKYHPEDTITRAEACAMIARLMTGDPNVSQYTGAQNFADVAKGSWKDSAIGYCYINNIVVGVGNNKFEPDRAITDAEFITMVVRAMGYETPDMTQGYPFSYMSNAQAIGLLDGVNMVASTDALRGEDAQVIYNAMFTDYARGAMLVNTTHGTSVESYPTLAESVWGLDRAAVGTWNEKSDEDVTLTNCKAHTWVVIGAAQDEENAILAYPIDDDTTDLYKSDDKNKQYATYKFKYDGDVDSIRGYQVELWGEGSHGEPTWEKGKSDGTFVYSEDWKIKAIKTVKGQTKYDYNPSMADSKADNGTIVLDDETSLDLDSVAGNAKNVQSSDAVPTQDIFMGDSLNTVSIKDDKSVEKALNVRNGAQYQLMDWDSDGDVDWVVVDEAHYYKVEAVSSKRVTVASMDSNSDLKSDKDEKVETWKLDDSEKIATNNARKDVKIKYEVPDGLAEGDIVEVTYKVTNEDKSQIITATVSVVDSENKTLDKVATKDGLTLTFSDEEMKVAQNAELGDVIVPENPQEYKDFNGEELGTEFALWTNRNGFIVYSDYATQTSNYMMVLNTAGGKDVTGSRELAEIDIMTSAGEEKKDVKVSSSARVLDINGDTLKDSSNNLAYDKRAFDEAQVVGNVFKYWTDEDGVITKMQAVFDSNRKETTDYRYDADADRLVNDAGKYVASLEDANVIFAVRSEYIKKDGTTNATVLTRDDLIVDADDVHATKQADIPDIGTDPTDEELINSSSLSRATSWLGAGATSNNTKYAVQLDKNSEATAAILGVSNFNKFNAGTTKLGLVTNVSEDKNGVIEIMAAYDGKVEAVSSVEKQDFEDIVKVFDGSSDKSVAGADSTISAAGNGIFDGGKLSQIVNNGGQYAEITTNADGKLTKVVFLDDDTQTTTGINNENKLRGHYYTVSRNLVLKTDNKKLQYALNDNQTYDDVTAAQYFASDSELYSVGRLEASSSSYADDAKFYTVDAKPTRHDEDYAGTRLTVNAGFDSLDAKDITVGEYSDIAFYQPDYRTDDNIYEISDLAFNSDNELVAAYSFKNLDEQTATDIAVVSAWDANGVPKTSFNADDVVTLRAALVDSDSTMKLNTLKVYDQNGLDVTSKFNVNVTTGSGSRVIGATITIPTDASGKYTIKGAYNGTVYAGGLTIDVAASTKRFEIAQIEFTNLNATAPAQDVNPMADNKSFGIYVTGDPTTRSAGSVPVTTLTANDLTVKLGAAAQPFTLMNKGNGYYVITLTGTGVDLSQPPYNAAGLTVELTPASGSNVVAPSAGLAPLVDADIPNKNNDATGGIANGGSSVGDVTGAGNVARLKIDDTQFAGVGAGTSPVTKVEVKALTADTTETVVKNLTTSDFTVTVDGEAATVNVSDGNNDGVYDVTVSQVGSTPVTDLRGSTVVITVNGKSATASVPAAVASAQMGALSGSVDAKGGDFTATVTLNNIDASQVATTLTKKAGSGDLELTTATFSGTGASGNVTLTVPAASVGKGAIYELKDTSGNVLAEVEIENNKVTKATFTASTPTGHYDATAGNCYVEFTITGIDLTESQYAALKSEIESATWAFSGANANSAGVGTVSVSKSSSDTKVKITVDGSGNGFTDGSGSGTVIATMTATTNLEAITATASV